MHVLKNTLSLIQRKKLYSCLSTSTKTYEIVGSLICERKSSDRYAIGMPQCRIFMSYVMDNYVMTCHMP